MTQTELGFQPGARRGNVAHPLAARRHMHGDSPDVVLLETVRFAQVARGFDGRVRAVTGRVILEQVVAQVQPAGWLPQPGGGVEVGAVCGGEALQGFDGVAAAGEAACCQLCGHHAVGAGLAGVQGLAHRAEHRLQSRGLRGRNAQGIGGVVRIELQQAGAGCGRAECADGAGAVEAQRVVPRRHGRTDAAQRLVAGDEGRHERRTAVAARFGQCQQGWHQHHTRMACERHVDIVEIERV